MKTTSCHDISLDTLLAGDDRTPEYRRGAEHVEACPDCQRRLMALAADEPSWAEVRSALRPDETSDLHASSEARVPLRSSSAPQPSLSFLAPPSHPEMLGRLGRYEIERVIGSGGMGIVLKAFDTELNRPVAIKVLAPHLAHSGPARQRFSREARAAAAVVHEHVVAIHNVESEHEVPFLVMQYVPGRSLQERVDQDGPLAPAEILRIALQTAAGLAAAHAQGVVHRDVKPANILLEDGVERVRITDFGLARAAADASVTHSGIVSGTPHYMSPEQARGQATDAASDLFSLGAVLYFMATGHPPFRAEHAMGVLHRICHDTHRPVWQMNSTLPPGLVDVIDRLLEKRSTRRFATALEAHEAIARVLSGADEGVVRWVRRFVRRHTTARRKRIALVGAAALVTGLITWQVRALRPAPAPTQRPIATPALFAKMLGQLRDWNSPSEADLVAAEESLRTLVRMPYPEAALLGSTPEAWISELRAAERDVARLEQSWSAPGAGAGSSSRSQKGEEP